MTTGIVISARMTSSRFPGKVLAPLLGAPVLWHVIDRARKVPFVDRVIVAVPADNASIPIIELCNHERVLVLSGSEHDVLDRYYDAAAACKLDVIVRITGDCPFFDPVIAGEVIALRAAKNFDYTSNVHPKRTYPKGYDVEAFTFDALEAAHQLARLISDREHVTPYLQRTRGISRGCVRQKVNQSGWNFCVDVPDDIPRLTKIFSSPVPPENQPPETPTRH